MDTLLLDLKVGFRSLLRAPIFTASAVLALALGIGASSAIFAFCDAMLLRPFAFDDEGIVVAAAAVEGFDRSEIPGDVALQWRERTTQLTQMSFFEWSEVNLTGTDEAEHVIGYRVDPSFFSVLPVQPILGRPLSGPGVHEVVLSWALWQRRFNGDERAIGRQAQIDGESYLIAGVMPRDFRFPKAVTLWLPLNLTAANAADHGVEAVARIKPGANPDQARQELAAVHQQVLRDLPRRISTLAPSLFPLRDYGDELSRLMLRVLMASVVLLLLIGCANVGNMLLARASGRWREIAIRGAMGATRGRLLRQLLTESVLLSLAASALGLLFAAWGIDAIRAMIPPDVSRFIAGWDHVGLDARLLTFSMATAAATAVLSGLAPALRASRLDLHGVLQRESATASMGGEKRRFRGGLLLGQTLLAVVLAVCAGLVVRSFLHQLRMSYGFEPGQVLSLRVAPAETRYRDDASLIRFTNEALGRLRALPGVESASEVNLLPLSGMSQTSSVLPEGMPADSKEASTSLYRRVSSEYFQTLRIPILAGRPIDGTDVAETARAVVISRTLAERLYGSAEAAPGHRLRTSRSAGAPLRTVVGVAADVRQADLRDSMRASVYVAQAQTPENRMAFVLRTTVPPLTLGLQARQALRSVDADQPVSDIATLAMVIDDGVLVGPRVTTVLLGAFAIVSLLLTAIGLYGTLSYSVAQRRREIGIRLALGAVPSDVVRLVVRQGMLPAVLGLLLGIPAALGAGQALGALLIGVSPADPLTFAAVALFLCAVALAASWAPARRAARTDPGIALRAE